MFLFFLLFVPRLEPAMARGASSLKTQSACLILAAFAVVLVTSACLLFGSRTRVVEEPIHFDESFVFHSYWQHGFGRKQALSVKSLLIKERELFRANPDTTVVIWTEDDPNETATNPWIQQMVSLGVQIRYYDPAAEAVGTPLEGNDIVTKAYEKTAFHSDWVRLIELYKYGGLYFDLDILFLKDITPLIRKYGEFAYPWITRRGKINNAFLRFKKKSPVITDLLVRAGNERRATGVHGFSGFMIKYKPRDLNLIPYELIDFCWLDWVLCPYFNFRWFFKSWNNLGWLKKRRAMNGFKSSYVYHWHNRWNDPIMDGSPFERFEREFDAILDLPHNVGNSTF